MGEAESEWTPGGVTRAVAGKGVVKEKRRVGENTETQDMKTPIHDSDEIRRAELHWNKVHFPELASGPPRAPRTNPPSLCLYPKSPRWLGHKLAGSRDPG